MAGSLNLGESSNVFYEYDFSVIYNCHHALLGGGKSSIDKQLAENVAEYLVNKLEKERRNDKILRGYFRFRDAMPGNNIFHEFFDNLEKSRYVILIITPGLVEENWSQYLQQCAYLRKVIDEVEIPNVFIPIAVDNIAVGIAKFVPRNICLENVQVFMEDYKKDKPSWEKLMKALNVDRFQGQSVGPARPQSPASPHPQEADSLRDAVVQQLKSSAGQLKFKHWWPLVRNTASYIAHLALDSDQYASILNFS